MIKLALILLTGISIIILILAIRNAYRIKSAINKIKNKKSYYFIITNILAAICIMALIICYIYSAYNADITTTNFIASFIFLLCSSFIYLASIITHDMGLLLEKLDNVRKLDSLTKILNRRQIMKEVKKEFKRYQRYKRPATLAILDINQFKKVNDTYGHQTGDAVILDFVKTVLSNCRKTDRFGRYGGDEFILLLPETGYERARLLIERLQKSINDKNIMVNNHVIKYSISIGLSELTLDIQSFEKWLHQADLNLLDIKRDLYSNQNVN